MVRSMVRYAWASTVRDERQDSEISVATQEIIEPDEYSEGKIDYFLKVAKRLNHFQIYRSFFNGTNSIYRKSLTVEAR